MIPHEIPGMESDEQAGDDDDDDDDEGSWESIDSDEEEVEKPKSAKPKSATKMIYEFFNKMSYRHHATEESAFEAMYS